MSISHELLLNTQNSIEYYVQNIEAIFKNKLNIGINTNRQSDCISLFCEYLTIYIHLDEYIGLDIIEEDYNFKANMSIRFYLIVKTWPKGMDTLFSLIKHLMFNNNDNLLLIENGETRILSRVDGIFYADAYFEQTYPFEIFEI